MRGSVTVSENSSSRHFNCSGPRTNGAARPLPDVRQVVDSMHLGHGGGATERQHALHGKAPGLRVRMLFGRDWELPAFAKQIVESLAQQRLVRPPFLGRDDAQLAANRFGEVRSDEDDARAPRLRDRGRFCGDLSGSGRCTLAGILHVRQVSHQGISLAWPIAAFR